MESQFIDLHIHPAMKPLGKSFNSTPGKNSSNKNRSNSIWHYDPPTALDKLANITTTLTKFRQSDFTSLAKGGADIVVVSLCGLEKGFVMNKLGTSLVGDVVGNLVTGLGKKQPASAKNELTTSSRWTTTLPTCKPNMNFTRNSTATR